MDLNTILRSTNFRFKKGLGQNFISDTNLLSSIVNDAGVKQGDVVIEIGSGAGSLTKVLADKAGKVYSFEIDSELVPVLEQTLKGYENVKIIFKDILKMTDQEIKSIISSDFKVVANLPYYITTNLIMRFIESELPCSSITIMVQKEVAERLTALHDTPAYGAITLAIRLWGDAKILRSVNKEMFFPVPKVDSAVVHIERNTQFSNLKDKKKVAKLIKTAFHMRRKTFANNLIANFSLSKEVAKAILIDNGYSEKTRGEALSIEDLIKISLDERL